MLERDDFSSKRHPALSFWFEHDSFRKTGTGPASSAGQAFSGSCPKEENLRQMVTAWVSRIHIYPIKSLDATTLERVRVLSSGALEFDRTWAMFDADGKIVSGKRHAAVHRLRSVIDLAGQKLSICAGRAPRFPDPAFSLDCDREKIEQWLGEYFGFPIELRKNSEAGFPEDAASPGPTIISVATLQEIARWFSLPFEQVRARFRTNIEVDGVPAFWEDRLFGMAGEVVRFAIGDAVFEGINPCQRCVVPTRDPLSGVEDKTIARRFTELRKQSLPPWSERSRFNHFYRVAVNTRPSGDHGGKTVRNGDPVQILENSHL
jgi:uncharacterized protein YcbX